VVATGSREWDDFELVVVTFDELGVSSLAHGDCRGLDRLADQWAKLRNVPHRAFPAQWDLYGESAGARRNRDMFHQWNPDRIVAFKDNFGAERGGTEDMVSVAQAKGVPITYVNSNGRVTEQQFKF
jgi:precorrin-6x reductase